MVLRKGLRRNILILLAEISDELAAMSPRSIGRAVYGSGYEPRSLASELYRLSRIGEIERVIDRRGRPCLRLTSAGRRTLKENVPLFDLRRRRWDGIWRMVIFDVKEKERYLRDGLRYKLERLGFGQWQRSVYITPLDVMDEMNQYLENQGVEEMAFCLKATLGDRDRDQDLAAEVWKLGDLAADYLDFIDYWRNRKKGSVIKFWADYQVLIERDPFLPDELLPDGWPGVRANLVFRRVLKLVFKGEFLGE